MHGCILYTVLQYVPAVGFSAREKIRKEGGRLGGKSGQVKGPRPFLKGGKEEKRGRGICL